jgi:hypothetical protein
MIETFIRLFKGLVFFTYGGSGTGKTTLLFGRDDMPGLINVMLQAITENHPMQKKIKCRTYRSVYLRSITR